MRPGGVTNIMAVDPEMAADPEMAGDSKQPSPPAPRAGAARGSLSQAPGSPRVATGPREGSKPPGSSRLVFVVAAIALLVVGLALANQSRKAAALAARVAELEAELARAEAVVGAYQVRFEQVRGEVNDLLTQVGALSNLVERDVLPADASGAPEDVLDASGF